jgi:predicted RNase H-like HicB family nuclease
MMDICFDTLIWLENTVYVSYCPQLDVSSCGDTVEDARKMLREAVRLFLEVAEEKGTLQDILKESGYHLENN